MEKIHPNHLGVFFKVWWNLGFTGKPFFVLFEPSVGWDFCVLEGEDNDFVP
jgi:hypothetical protein